MKAMVGDTGVLIPRRMLRGVREVDIRKDRHKIVVELSRLESDPIFNLGRNPVRVDASDGAERHDAHLYAVS